MARRVELETGELLLRIRPAIRTRKITLIAFFILASGLKFALRVPIPNAVLVVISLWFLSTFAFVSVIEKQRLLARTEAIHLGYLIAELLILTYLIHHLGAVEWIGAVFYVFTIIYANFLLSSRMKGIMVALTASLCYILLVFLEYLGIFPHQIFFTPRLSLYQDAHYVITTVIGVSGVFGLVAYTTGIFAEVLRQKSQELKEANKKIASEKEELQKAGGRLNQWYRDLDEKIKERTADLEASKAYNEGILEALPDGLSIIDLEGRHIDVNLYLLELLGYKKEELIGKSALKIIVERDLERGKWLIRETLTRGPIRNFELTLLTKDKKEISAMFNTSLIRDSEGKITRAFAVIRDMSQTKRLIADLEEAKHALEQRTRELKETGDVILSILEDTNEAKKEIEVGRKRLENIMESMIDGLTITDMQGRITQINRAITEQLGYTPEEAVGKAPAELFLDERELPKFLEELKRLCSGEAIRASEYLCRRKDGTEVPVSINFSILRDYQGKPNGIIAVHRDITELKWMQEQREALIKDLERSNRELDDFTYIVSHDLKEPLRSIDAFSKFIEDDCRDKLNQESRNYLGRIRANADRMQALIEDLLEISRIERRRNPFEEVQVEELIDEAKLRLEYVIRQKNAEIIIRDKLPKVFCDRVRLAEVFVNLFSNAIKFNDKTQPRVEIGCNQKGNFYEFCVKDNGPGIEKQYFDKIFEIFQRLGKREDYEGTGAGLTIVKKIVQMHRGKVWVESKIGEGATFYFTIPKEKGVILGKKKIGEILIEKKMLTEVELKAALEEQEGRR